MADITKGGFDAPSDSISRVLKSCGVDAGKAVCAVKSDMKSSYEYGEMWAFLFDDAFVIAADDGSFTRLPLSDIEEIKSESLASTGQLVAAKKNGTDEFLCAFSNSRARTFGRISRMANKLMRGEELSDEDFKDEDDDNVCPHCGRRYPDPMTKICPKCSNKRALFMRVLGYMPRYKKEIFTVFALILLTSAVHMIRPYVSGTTLYDEVLTLGGKYYGKVFQLVGVLIAMELLTLGANILQGRIGASIAAKIIYDIKVEVFTAMQRLSMSFFSNKHTGNLMNRVNSDALDIQYFLNDGMPYFVINAITLIGVTVMMFILNPLLAVLMFLPVPLIVFMVRRVVPKFRRLKWLGWIKSSKLNSVINDSLLGIRVVKAFGKEKNEIDRFEGASDDLFNNRLREGYQGAKTFPVLSYIMGLGGLMVWIFGGSQVMNGAAGMTYGRLMTFIGYTGMLYGPIDFMVNTFDWWTNCMNSAQRIFEIIDRKSDVLPPENPVRMPQIKGDIELRGVTFAYEPNKPVLHDISLHINSGEMLGLVGHSGAGKSTITNIITRLYDVEDGEVLIDGVNIKDIDPDDLHSQIGMVLQDTFLFSGTIEENIKYARPDATHEEVIAAAKSANAHDFIMKLPDGYETELGRRKTNLSGGERQRLSIARAILLDPRILIMDEATASVDTETEALIQQALENLVRGRTTIAIAHRLSTLRNADRLAVIDHGTLAELGTGAELEEKHGIYYDMLERQREALKYSDKMFGDDEKNDSE